MNIKLVGNKLVNADVISPFLVIAEFNEGLAYTAKVKYTETLVAGHKMLSLYNQFRDDLTVANVALMLVEMDRVRREMEYNMFVAYRK
jgi:hypothetical protein